MFVLNVLVALFQGALIGAERRWRQRIAGMQTNALVAAGSALFVTLSAMTVGQSSPTESSLAIRSLHSRNSEHPGTIEVVAALTAMGHSDPALERVVSRLSLESGVSTTSWELADGGS